MYTVHYSTSTVQEKDDTVNETGMTGSAPAL